jgi:hypothetical protein
MDGAIREQVPIYLDRYSEALAGGSDAAAE